MFKKKKNLILKLKVHQIKANEVMRTMAICLALSLFFIYVCVSLSRLV